MAETVGGVWRGLMWLAPKSRSSPKGLFSGFNLVPLRVTSRDSNVGKGNGIRGYIYNAFLEYFPGEYLRA